MKYLLRILLLLSVGLIAYGAYMNLTESLSGQKCIGFGVVILAFVLMPLFIYHRYKNKDLSNYSFKDDWWNPKNRM